jgi:hypothetical protein
MNIGIPHQPARRPFVIHKKTIDVPATTKEIITHITCDFCGKKIKEGNYSINEVCVRHKVGSSYPEMGEGTDTIFDMCGECFDAKLIPWAETLGVMPRIKEWDY